MQVFYTNVESSLSSYLITVVNIEYLPTWVYSYVANLVTRTQYYYINLVAKAQWILQCIAEKDCDLRTCLIVMVLYALASVLCVKLCMYSVGVCTVATKRFHSLIHCTWYSIIDINILVIGSSMIMWWGWVNFMSYKRYMIVQYSHFNYLLLVSLNHLWDWICKSPTYV